MKPLRLKMQAFGSYGKETVVDFEKVNQNLFLITGDTGAGNLYRSTDPKTPEDDHPGCGKGKTERSNRICKSCHAGWDRISI